MYLYKLLWFAMKLYSILLKLEEDNLELAS